MPPVHTRKCRRFKLLACAALVVFGRFASAHSTIAEQIAVLSAQLARNPRSADLLVRRADLYREERQWTEAFADLDRAERIDPALATPDLVRARAHFDRGRWKAAVDAASRFLTHQPRHGDALVVRARAYARLGQHRAAAGDFTEALATRPLPDLFIERARVLAEDGGDGLTRALHSLDEGIVRLGPIVTLELEAIEVELRLNRYDAALARVDRISAQTPRKDSWLARRGAILERAGRLDEAHAAYRAALDAATSQPERIQHTGASMALVARLRADIARLDGRVNDHGQKRSR